MLLTQIIGKKIWETGILPFSRGGLPFDPLGQAFPTLTFSLSLASWSFLFQNAGMYDLKNRIALVTGANSGIGKAATERFLLLGAKVAALGRSEEKVFKTVEELSSLGTIIPVVADVADEEAVAAAIQECVDKLGGLDIVFSNAGINGTWAPIDEIEVEEWDKTIAVNLRGTFLVTKFAVPHMKKNGGSIIITSSINGTRVFSTAGATAYSSTKAAQVAFAKMTALELAKYRIRVNVICPGAIRSAIGEKTKKRKIDKAGEPSKYPEGEIPLTDGEPGESEEVANLVMFLASDEALHISGTEVWIDGAQSLLMG
ncbi:MAG TPA: SDR family NAD(P)-dependent oxidoreductase [Opitutales bacterium]|nr:SDR family NAD(P)-dependent oxidoreductase [Opitutales bacterium]